MFWNKSGKEVVRNRSKKVTAMILTIVLFVASTVLDHDIFSLGKGTASTVNEETFPVTLIVDGETETFYLTRSHSVGDLLEKAGVVTICSDALNYSADEHLSPDMQVNLQHRHNIEITVGNDSKILLVPKGTLAQGLAYGEIEVGPDDEISVGLDTPVYSGMQVTIAQVYYENETAKESIPFKTVKSSSDKMPNGEIKILTAGKTGERQTVFRKKFINGNLTETATVSSEIAIAPVEENIIVGTKQENKYRSDAAPAFAAVNAPNTEKGQTFKDSAGKNVAYKSMMSGSCTAYYASSPNARTSTGKVPQKGLVAVNPKIIPYGTKMYICSPDGSYVYGYAIAADTGGALMSGQALVDVYYPDLQSCIDFGRRKMNVYILD